MAASKLKQILQLEPASEISFQGPFEHVVTSYLYLKNPSDKRICFKVKTTAPKRYCVRPNSGIVEPAGEIKIAIMLQPLDPDGEAEARTKHKFMVQSTMVNSDDENIPLDEIWQKTPPELIMDSKLRCVFQQPANNREDGSQGDAFFRKTTDPGQIPDVAKVHGAGATTTSSSSILTQQQMEPARKQRELVNTSTPVSASRASAVASSTKPPALRGLTSDSDRKARADEQIRAADKSSHNLTSSFMQPMSDDYKIVLVSLVMLVLGVILGKYII